MVGLFGGIVLCVTDAHHSQTVTRVARPRILYWGQDAVESNRFYSGSERDTIDPPAG